MPPTQNQTRHKIHQLIQKHQAMTEAERREITEAGVVHQFLDPLLEALGCELWQEVMGEPWDQTKGAIDPAERQTLRDELDALVAHLYRLSRDDLAHILTTFPLVFPDDTGQAKKQTLLATYDHFAEETKNWQRQ